MRVAGQVVSLLLEVTLRLHVLLFDLHLLLIWWHIRIAVVLLEVLVAVVVRDQQRVVDGEVGLFVGFLKLLLKLCRFLFIELPLGLVRARSLVHVLSHVFHEFLWLESGRVAGQVVAIRIGVTIRLHLLKLQQRRLAGLAEAFLTLSRQAVRCHMVHDFFLVVLVGLSARPQAALLPRILDSAVVPFSLDSSGAIG